MAAPVDGTVHEPVDEPGDAADGMSGWAPAELSRTYQSERNYRLPVLVSAVRAVGLLVAVGLWALAGQQTESAEPAELPRLGGGA